MQGHVGTPVRPPDEGLEPGFARAKQASPPRSSSPRPGPAAPLVDGTVGDRAVPEGAHVLLYI